MASEYASSRRGGLQIAYSFTETKDLSHTESELQQVEALPVRGERCSRSSPTGL